MFRILSTLLLTCLVATSVFADMVHIAATRDATMIEDPGGALANGSGPALFAGSTNQTVNGIRRALIHFDVATALPENAMIDRVFLSLYQSSNNAMPSAFSLHRILADWGEGASFSTGGKGAPAEPSDATWLHTFYDVQYWVQEGGQFIPHASATEVVEGADFYTWQSTTHLVNDVRLWLHAPQKNFGWLVMGDEDAKGSVKRFDSREGMTSGQHPMLTVEYHMLGE